jgi:Anti-sigma-K factor rskA, C-terminal/Putative zinc-finger
VADHELAGLRCSEVLELSGAFVLGALTPEEMDAVRAHLAACPEAHAEFAELGGVVPALFEAVEPVAPPPGLKARILAAAAADAERTIDTDRTVKPFPAGGTQRRGWDVGALFRRPIWAGIAAAAMVAAIALGALSLSLKAQLDGLTAYRNGVVEVLEEAARPGAQLAVLVAPETAPGPTGLAAVGADGSVAMVMRDLAPTTGTQVYTAWLIGADGTPIPVGDFEVDASRTASFTTAHATLGPGVKVAVSREPQAGATKPTTVVAVGTAQEQSS